MWRGWSRSGGCRSRRSVAPASRAHGAQHRRERWRAGSHPSCRAERRGEPIGRHGRAGAAGPPTRRSARPARRAARACRRRPGATKPRGSTPASLSTRRPASTARRVSSASRPTNSRVAPPGTRASELARRAARATWRCWKPCWAIASPARRALRQPAAPARAGGSSNGCRSGAGITSSVTRSTPWSSSQSRISAQRSNVAGSTSCSETASRRSSAALSGDVATAVRSAPARAGAGRPARRRSPPPTSSGRPGRRRRRGRGLSRAPRRSRGAARSASPGANVGPGRRRCAPPARWRDATTRAPLAAASRPTRPNVSSSPGITTQPAAP